MYNRYSPREDGTYTRNKMHDAGDRKPPNIQQVPPVQQETNEHTEFLPREQNEQHHKTNGGFLKQLLPKGFDTGDLIVILLLLLMAGDCEEDRNNAILTIALYFLM